MNSTGVLNRWGIALPNDYLRIWEAGLLESTSDRVIWLSDVQWLSPSDIEVFAWPTLFKANYVPFARSGRMDLYCWQKSAPNYVAWCPRTEIIGKILAKDFRSSVYRLFLEELSCCRLADVLEISPSAVGAVLQSYVDRLEGQFKSDWIATLRSLLAREPRFDGNVLAYATDAEIDQIVEQRLAFESLNVEISHFQD